MACFELTAGTSFLRRCQVNVELEELVLLIRYNLKKWIRYILET